MKGFAVLFLFAAILASAISECEPGPIPTEESAPTLGDTWARTLNGTVMAYVPAGKFEMGGTDGDPDEQPVHNVALDGFWVDQTEVTNAQFAAFLNARGNQEEGGVTWLDLQNEDCLIEWVGDEFRPKSGYADYPMIEVSWYGAVAYCEWVGARLPTEAEWEYAARGTEGRIFPWGSDAPTCEQAQFRACSGRTVPVGSLLDGASWCQALDMAGNVWEWVSDWYGGYSSGRQVNPTGPYFGERRVLRGGSFHFVPYSMRGTNRNSHRPDFTNYSSGFRCARD